MRSRDSIRLARAATACLCAMLAIAGCVALSPQEHAPDAGVLLAGTGSCGVERWSVKTGSDPDAGLVNLNSPTPQSIVYLTGLPAPSPLPANGRIQPTETTEFVVDATLTKYKLESDSDYHLVLADAQGRTMIAEIPDPVCVGSSSPFTSGIANARNEFDAKYSATTSFQTVSIPVEIRGVGFFDYKHGQTGVAPNAIELHPVLDIVFNPTGGGTGGSVQLIGDPSFEHGNGRADQRRPVPQRP